MTIRTVDSADDLAEGVLHLARAEPRFAALLARTGPLPLRRKPPGFATLLDAIISQQVSTASASAIWRRLVAAGLTDAACMAAATEDDLRACGLSRPKMRYALALARGGPDYGAMHGAGDEEVIAALVRLPGIGRWTAEVYALQALGRADVFPAGDLALQEAARRLFALDARPAEPAFRAMAEPWAPWRAVAARALWAYYRLEQNREGIR